MAKKEKEEWTGVDEFKDEEKPGVFGFEKKKDEPEVKPVVEPDEFTKAVEGLRARIAGMQLRPGDTVAFNADLDRLAGLR